MELLHDIRTLYHLAFTRQRGDTHQERLEHFYKGQAAGYDSFRKRLLHGRAPLIAEIEKLARPGSVWIDMGAGTGFNLELGEHLRRSCSSIYLVDLADSLLKVAEQRARSRGWTNVHFAKADAASFNPEGPRADLITFSYSLTMIPGWKAVLQHAYELLSPGGLIGVTDFYVSKAGPPPGFVRHSWAARKGWPAWFAMDGVYFNEEHLPFLLEHFEPLVLSEKRGRVPYLLGLSAPYFVFVGRKAA